jgi:hypothetical protein
MRTTRLLCRFRETLPSRRFTGHELLRIPIPPAFPQQTADIRLASVFVGVALNPFAARLSLEEAKVATRLLPGTQAHPEDTVVQRSGTSVTLTVHGVFAMVRTLFADAIWLVPISGLDTTIGTIHQTPPVLCGGLQRC